MPHTTRVDRQKIDPDHRHTKQLRWPKQLRNGLNETDERCISLSLYRCNLLPADAPFVTGAGLTFCLRVSCVDGISLTLLEGFEWLFYVLMFFEN